MIVPVLVFVGTLSLILGGYWLFVSYRDGRARRIVKERLQFVGAPAGVSPVQLYDLVKAQPDTLPPGAVRQVVPMGERAWKYVQHLVERSGLQMPVRVVLYWTLALLAAGYLIGAVATGSHLLALAGAAAAAGLPIVYLKSCARRRIRKFEEHFPEAIDIIARALRAGHALTTGIVMVAEEVPEPVSTEFRLLYEHQNYGLPMSDALREFADRVPLLDARLFVTAVLVQREVGGNLSEVLDNLATVMRARAHVRHQVQALTAHGRFTGWILGLMPVALGLLLCVLNPEHPRMLLEDPLGVRMIAGAAVLQVMGMLVVRKIVAVEY